MSFFGSFSFFASLFLALIPAIILGLKEKPLRHYTLFLSVLFIAMVYHTKPTQLLYLCLFYLLQTALVKLYFRLRAKYGQNPYIYRLFLITSVLPLILSKLKGFFSLGLFAFLGISYLTFRVAQIIIETYDGIIEEIPFLEFTSFLLFFPSVSSGPIDRSKRFHKDYVSVYTRVEYLNLLGEGFSKILLGLVYKFVLASIFTFLMGRLSYGSSWYAALGITYCYGFELFFDFAGYSLMAVGTSYILGVRTPDNFRFPFLCKDIKDFWDRWHITLSHWFRDFIFSRFMMASIKQKWFRTRLTGASTGFILNMVIMGIWHGLTASYILYGLYHGILLMLTEIYQKKSKFYKKHKKQNWYLFGSWFLTFQCVMFGFFIFSGDFLAMFK